MRLTSKSVEKSEEVPFWFNPYSEMYDLLYGYDTDRDGKKIIRDTKSVIMIGSFFRNATVEEISFEMDELEELVGVLGSVCKRRFIQRMHRHDKGKLIGIGKMNEIKEYVTEENIGYIVCNKELTALQHKQLVDFFDVPVVDRTMIVLEIFNRQARTRESQLQIQIAILKYLKSRINTFNLSEHNISDRANGAFFNRGKGESLYELNQRKVTVKIDRMQKEIDRINCSRKIQQKKRSSAIKIVLIGYTNAGKTSIMNALSNQKLDVGDQMFKTTDSVYRRMGKLRDNDVLICDTVGFVSKLPTTWIEGFHSTIDDISEADLVLHVVDRSDPNYLRKTKVTDELLTKMEIPAEKVMKIYNKIDLLNEELVEDSSCTYVSTMDKDLIKNLREKVYAKAELIIVKTMKA